MIPHLVPEIEGGYPERDGEGEEEGLVLEYSRCWILEVLAYVKQTYNFHQITLALIAPHGHAATSV